MITTTLLNIFNLMISWFLTLRPAWQPSLPASVANVIAFSQAYDTYLPIHETLTCLGFVLTAFAAFVSLKWTTKIVDWVADVIP